MTTAAAAPVFRRVYVWEFPVRAFHWINALCIFALGATGYLIGHPISLHQMPEAYQQSWFGTVRMVHFTTAFVLVINFLLRIYWSFVGNDYARWHQFIPWRRQHWREIGEVMRVDLLQTDLRGHISIGHNRMASLIYFVSFLVVVFQTFTGFALYADMSHPVFGKLFGWVSPLMGGDMQVRQWHHAALWFYVLFILVHVYLVFYHDYVEGRGTTSSMVGGWKFERDDELGRR